MNQLDLYWLAGLLEGEGSFCAGPPSQPNVPVIAFTTTDEDVIQRVAVLFDGPTYFATKKQEEHWKQAYKIYLRGSKAVALMRELHPLMGKRRQTQIDNALASYQILPKTYNRNTPADVVSLIRQLAKEGMGTMEISREVNVESSKVSRIKRGLLYKNV